jgi:hypothetical protein
MLSWTIAVGDRPERPECNAGTLGKLFPIQANGNSRLTNRLFTCGELQVCTRGRWRYKWSLLSVRLDQLSKDGTVRRPPACVALMDELTKEAVAPLPAPALGGAATGENN